MININEENGGDQILEAVKNNLFVSSGGGDLKGRSVVRGYDFNEGLDYEKLFRSYRTTGFQAGAFGEAIEEVRRMITWRPDGPLREGETTEERKNTRCKIFLGYTSNLVSSGVREVIRFLVQHRMVDVVVSTAGGIEEDFIKCFAPTYTGEFAESGAKLRGQGLNRIGNLIMPNDNYSKFDDWMMPILDQMLEEQKSNGTVWTPSKLIDRLGREINCEESIYYWAHKNGIPVFSPAITDGAIGDVLYLHSIHNPGLVLDLVTDIREMNNHAAYAIQSGVIILGGGVIKHHICNANLYRNGADYVVFINTGQEFDGSDSGARPDEAISWGKIKIDAKPVKVYCEASIVFPILVAETFLKHQDHFATPRITNLKKIKL